VSGPFAQVSDADVIGLVEAYPLASVVSYSSGYLVSTLPVLVESDAAGTPVSLLGHIPRAHSQAQVFGVHPRTLFLFSGPNGYISPEYVGANRNWAPTWNFAVVRMTADVILDESLTEEAIEKLVTFMERERPEPWSTREMGERYGQLRQRVVGFRADIVAVEARFKLGQDERPDVLSSILDGLNGTDIGEWMRRYNEPKV
jgi:transcriptional regulator